MGLGRASRSVKRLFSVVQLLQLDEQSYHNSPSLARIAVLCLFWYSSSALTNNTSKQLMGLLSIPVTLTWIQFGFVALFCYLFSKYMLPPSRRIHSLNLTMVKQTAVISLFQISGHVFSSVALTRVAVSFSHTIKALSPLFTVLLYRFIYNIAYSPKVYTSLIPLTLGVMLVCASGLQFDFVGFFCSLSATIIFVVQNIVSKKILVVNQPATSHQLPSSSNPQGTGSDSVSGPKLDKMNMLFHCGTMSFVFMIPIWFYYEGSELLFNPTSASFTPLHPGFGTNSSRPMFLLQVVILLLVNGVTHFMQNLFAFSLLAVVSPVHYSVASLLKRIAVISASMVWFGDSVGSYQAFGLLLTFFGLYLYQKARKSVDSGEAKWEANMENPEVERTQRVALKNYFQKGSYQHDGLRKPASPFSLVKEPSSPPVLAALDGGVSPIHLKTSKATSLYKSNQFENISKKSHLRRPSIHTPSAI